jgi:Tfp pilus tip-associated adhesin PilY1
MLHAFDATTGAERFAYVPSLVFANLKELADPAYDHRFYVDLTPTVKKAVGIFPGANQDTLLVGGLRGGGKGYFALDITDAKNIVSESGLASRVKWEYPIAADDDIGFSYSRSTIVKSNSSSHPWVVIFGNGYNSVNGSAVLYVLDAATGGLVRRLDTLAIPANNESANGLSTPTAIDLDYDQKADFVYAGDLYGNLWKFDLRFANPNDWAVAFGSLSDPKPLFQARGPNGQVQPITTKPDVMYHPKKHGLMVCFGTGKFLGTSDFGNTDTQTIYGVWDYGDAIYDLKKNGWSTDDNTEYLGALERSTGTLSNQPGSVGLLKQTFQDYEATFAGNPGTYRVFSEAFPDWVTMPDANGQEDDLSDSAANHAGYYIDLAPGDRIVSDVLIRGGILVAIGYKPENDRCSHGGQSMVMELNAFSGGNLALVQFDFNNDKVFTDDDKIDIDNDPNNIVLRIPSGLLMQGQAQMPAFLRLDNYRERLYISGVGAGGGGGSGGSGGGGSGGGGSGGGSGGGVGGPVQRAPKLGVTYWMQIFE